MSDWQAKASLGASSADRWLYCQTSVALTAQNPWVKDLNNSSFAQEGTLAHEVAEKYLRQRLLGETTSKRFTGPSYTPEMHEHGKSYAEYVGNLTEASVSPEMLHFVEVSTSYAQASKVRGIADYMGIDPKARRAYVIDYKYGAGVAVHPEGNLQLLTYAVAAQEIATAIGAPAETITVAIYQPRVWDGVNAYSYTAEEVEAHRERIVAANTAVLSGDRTRLVWQSTEKGCRFCPVKFWCSQSVDPERLKEMMKKLKTLADFEVLPIEELEEVYALAKEAEDIRKRAETALRARLASGEEGVALKLVHGFNYVDKEALKDFVAGKVASGELSEEDAFEEPRVKSKTALAKVLDADGKKELKALPTTPGAPRLVGVDAPGESVASGSAENIFSAIS